MPKKATDSIVSMNGSANEVAIIEKRETISNSKTPKQFVKRRPDGYDYVEESYMRAMLNKNYPNWSWIPSGQKPVELTQDWILVTCMLVIEDNGVQRSFFSPGCARITYKRDQPHTLENVVDLDKNVASANTNAFKRAINRLCNISDDVYKKQVRTDFMTEEQEKSYDELIQQAQKLGMPITRLATWKNAKEEVYQSNYSDAYSAFYDEVNHLKTKTTNKKTNKENK